jgi:hypothetical protein
LEDRRINKRRIKEKNLGEAVNLRMGLIFEAFDKYLVLINLFWS